jgi:hypothetical protein
VCWCCNSYSADKGAGTADRPGVGAALLITTVHAWYRRRRLRLWCSCTCRLAPRILYVFQRRRGGALLALTHESCKKKLAEEAIDPVAATECCSAAPPPAGIISLPSRSIYAREQSSPSPPASQACRVRAGVTPPRRAPTCRQSMKPRARRSEGGSTSATLSSLVGMRAVHTLLLVLRLPNKLTLWQ